MADASDIYVRTPVPQPFATPSNNHGSYAISEAQQTVWKNYMEAKYWRKTSKLPTFEGRRSQRQSNLCRSYWIEISEILGRKHCFMIAKVVKKAVYRTTNYKRTGKDRHIEALSWSEHLLTSGIQTEEMKIPCNNFKLVHTNFDLRWRWW